MQADDSQPDGSDIESLRAALQVLEAEVAGLRRRLSDAPRRTRQLEERLPRLRFIKLKLRLISQGFRL